MLNIFYYILLGLVAGTASGLIGIGGGVIMIPALIYIFGLSQHQAQGTTLALMVPPIGLLAAWTYYVNGHVNIKIAIFVCIGFFVGGLIGAKFAGAMPELVLKRVFWGSMLALSGYMLFFAK